MAETRVVVADSAIDRIFGPVIQTQTWINIVYLLFSFPLGVLYFVVLWTLFSTGIALLPVFVGLFVIWAGLRVADAFAEIERWCLNNMLGAGIPARPAAPAPPPGIWKRMAAAARRPGTLLGIGYLLLRFPIGIVSFTLVMVLAPLSILLLTAPLTYSVVPMMWFGTRIETFDEAIYLCCFGAVVGLISVHVLNSWALVCRRLGQAMLR